MLISKLPYPILYQFSNFVAFVLNRIIKYRKEVIFGNLYKAFPDKKEQEIQQIAKKFYAHFADIILEGIKNFSVSKKEAKKRFTLRNPELVFPYLEKGKTVICATAHYGNWEGYAISAPLHLPKYEMTMFYKKLSNNILNKKALKSRGRTGTNLVALEDTYSYFEQSQNQAKCVTLVADQSPSKHSKAIWVDFFGIKTACLHGIEKYAKMYNCPVVYLDIQRKKRGFYEIEVSLLTDKPLDLPNEKITQLYMQKVENVIRKKPENWLWSHRRWKKQFTA